jgi:hypothetical protein
MVSIQAVAVVAAAVAALAAANASAAVAMDISHSVGTCAVPNQLV